jgi:hypothetical protein
MFAVGLDHNPAHRLEPTRRDERVHVGEEGLGRLDAHRREHHHQAFERRAQGRGGEREPGRECLQARARRLGRCERPELDARLA